MTYSTAPALTLASWADLETEFDQWGENGAVPTLWWRDDDAVAWTDALARLVDLAGETPLGLAVIPAGAEPALAQRLAAFPRVSVLQHGWAHRNHSPSGAKKAELGADRPGEQCTAELALGFARIKELFGAAALPVLVPPWNRIAPDLPPRLPALGITGLSKMHRYRGASAAPGLRVVNTHVDLTDWGGGRDFVGEGAALAGLVRHLRLRRTGKVDGAEPTGILTHHLIWDQETRGFVARLLRLVQRRGDARFAAPSILFEAA
jgi:hypothetical protein